jgi:hypothetical protein
MAKIKKECYGMTIHTKGFVVEVKDENIDLLQKLEINDVFEVETKKAKFKGIKEDDYNNNESSDK